MLATGAALGGFAAGIWGIYPAFLIDGATFILSALLIVPLWVGPHPPLIDLPQHAGQVSAALAWLPGSSTHRAVFELNPFTPYLGSYLVAGPLVALFGPSTGLRLALSLALMALLDLPVAQRAIAANAERQGGQIALPAGGFYLWFHVGDAWEFTERLAREGGALVSPGDFYGAAGDGFVRVAVVLEGIFLGVGDTMYAFCCNIAGMWGVRVLGTVLMVRVFGFGLQAAWGAMVA